jgi:hypothetical protein
MCWKRRDGVMNAGARRVQRVYLVLLLDKSLLREATVRSRSAAPLDSPSEREIARQERMKREG